MNLEDQNASGNSNNDVSDNVGVGDQTSNQEDTVRYSTYKKVLGEKKAVDARIRELESRLSDYENSKLESEGQKDEVINRLRGQLKETESKLNAKEANYAFNVVSGQIKARAMQEGCSNPEKLIKLLDKTDFASVQVGDDYAVDGRDLDLLMDRAKKENPFLFNARSKGVRDLTPSNYVPSEHDLKKPLEKMSKSEIEAEILRLHQQG